MDYNNVLNRSNTEYRLDNESITKKNRLKCETSLAEDEYHNNNNNSSNNNNNENIVCNREKQDGGSDRTNDDNKNINNLLHYTSSIHDNTFGDDFNNYHPKSIDEIREMIATNIFHNSKRLAITRALEAMKHLLQSDTRLKSDTRLEGLIIDETGITQNSRKINGTPVSEYTPSISLAVDASPTCIDGIDNTDVESKSILSLQKSKSVYTIDSIGLERGKKEVRDRSLCRVGNTLRILLACVLLHNIANHSIVTNAFYFSLKVQPASSIAPHRTFYDYVPTTATTTTTTTNSPRWKVFNLPTLTLSMVETPTSIDQLSSTLGKDNASLSPTLPSSLLFSTSRTWTQRKAASVIPTGSATDTDNTLPYHMMQGSDQQPVQSQKQDNNLQLQLQRQRGSRSSILRFKTNSTKTSSERNKRNQELRQKQNPRYQQSQENRWLEKIFIAPENENSIRNVQQLRDQEQEPWQGQGIQKRRRRRREKMKPMPVRGYDALAIEEYYDLRPLEVGWRLNSLGLPLLGWYHSLLIDKALKRDSQIEVQRQRGRELRDLLINSNSVALIKSGQALSLRPDLVMNPYWAEELGNLVDAVGAFSDMDAMKIIKSELSELRSKVDKAKGLWQEQANARMKMNRFKNLSPLQKMVESDPILSLFEFYNDNKVIASASIGQVYKARIRPGAQLEAAIGSAEAARWGGTIVAIKVQRPDVVGSASLDMYLLRRTTTWLSRFRGGNLPRIADAFGIQLFGELDYIREANNCERFRELYGNNWDDVIVPAACTPLTRQRVLVLEWIEGTKGPWTGDSALEMVSIGLRCSVDQLMTTGLFHADPHRGNLLKTPDDKLGIIDFGSVVDIDEDFRYSLFGLVIGLQNKDLPLVTENLLKLGFLKDTTQLDQIIPRLTKALKNATGGSGRASDVNFARLQAEIDEISRENVLRFSTPPFFTIILRSLTILEGVAQSVDKNFRLVRGAYPYVLRQLLSGQEDSERQPKALQRLLVRLLTVDGKGEEIKWETLRDFLRLAQKATKGYNPSDTDSDEDKATISRKTLELFARFLTSGTGIFLKKPLIHELAETIDGMASIGEGMIIQASRGFLPTLPGMNGPVNKRRMDEVSALLETFQDALVAQDHRSRNGGTTPFMISTNESIARVQALIELVRGLIQYVSDSRSREEAGPLIDEVRSVVQLVAVEVLEIRGARAFRSILQLQPG